MNRSDISTMLTYVQHLTKTLENIYVRDGQLLHISNNNADPRFNIFDFPLYLYHVKLCGDLLLTSGCERGTYSSVREQVGDLLWVFCEKLSNKTNLKKLMNKKIDLDDVAQNANYLLQSFSGKHRQNLLYALQSISVSGNNIAPMAAASQYMIDWAVQMGRFEEEEGGKPTSMFYNAFSRDDDDWREMTNRVNRIHEWRGNLEHFSVDKASWLKHIRKWELDFTQLMIGVSKHVKSNPGASLTEGFVILICHDIFGGTIYGTNGELADELFIMRCVIYCELLTEKLLKEYENKAVNARKRLTRNVDSIYDEAEPDSYYFEVGLAILLLKSMNMETCMSYSAEDICKQLLTAMKASDGTLKLKEVVKILRLESNDTQAMSNYVNREKIAHITVSYLMTFLFAWVTTCRRASYNEASASR